MFMDDIKVFPQKERVLKTLIKIRIYSYDIGTEFGIENVSWS